MRMTRVALLVAVAFPVFAVMNGAARAQGTNQTGVAGQSEPSLRLAEAKKDEESPKSGATSKRRVRDLTGFDKSKASAPEVKAATREGGSPVLLAPHWGKFYGSDAIFQWSDKGMARSFRLTLLNKDREVVHEATVNASSFRLPDSLKLEPGATYCWSVETVPPSAPPSGSEGLGAAVSDQACFDVLPKAEWERMQKDQAAIPKKDPYKASLESADLYTNQRLWYDVLGVYNDLIAQHPDRAELYELRAEIYHQIPVTKDLEGQDLARAKELRAAGRAK